MVQSFREVYPIFESHCPLTSINQLLFWFWIKTTSAIIVFALYNPHLLVLSGIIYREMADMNWELAANALESYTFIRAFMFAPQIYHLPILETDYEFSIGDIMKNRKCGTKTAMYGFSTWWFSLCVWPSDSPSLMTVINRHGNSPLWYHVADSLVTVDPDLVG